MIVVEQMCMCVICFSLSHSRRCRFSFGLLFFRHFEETDLCSHNPRPHICGFIFKLYWLTDVFIVIFFVDIFNFLRWAKTNSIHTIAIAYVIHAGNK